jgi:hypothetical protein
MAMVIEASGSGQNIAALNERMMTDREGFDNNMVTSNAIAMAMKA